MKTVGIIGGLGPETTAEFYLDLIFSAFKKDPSQRPPILMWSVPLEYRVEEEFITTAKGVERYIPYLTDAAKRLEAGGANFIAIPCNSVHIFIEEIRRSVQIPILSIVEETVKYLQENNISNIGLLATKSTVDSGIYTDKLKQNNINVYFPSEVDQESVGGIINNLVRSRRDDKDKQRILEIIDRFENNKVKHILLACTDLQLIIPEHPRFKIIDTMNLLVAATVKYLL